MLCRDLLYPLPEGSFRISFFAADPETDPVSSCVAAPRFLQEQIECGGGICRINSLSDSYAAFKEENDDEYRNEKSLKEAFAKQAMEEFYDTMDDVFREGFGTVSQNAKDFSNGLTGLLFGAEK